MFKKGERQPGRPQGSGPKEVFNVQTVINNRFPSYKISLEQKVCALDVAKASPGRDYLKKYYSGQKLSARQAIIAQCCACLGYYADGKLDCECPLCSLYAFMPYREKEQK
jgi:hypothetical protein